MHFTSLVAAALPLLAAAAPRPSPTSVESSTSSTPSATPSASAFTVMALRSASPIHFLSMNAAGLRFYLGGGTASYCPTSVSPCPAGNQTVFTEPYVGLSIEVPGGQQLYVTPEGALGYTQAHSAYYPPGSVLGPISYTPITGAAFNGQISTSAFGATGFMACPTTTGNYQVFAAMQNATVPTGNTADCLGFDAVGVNYNGPLPAAWQYT